MNRSVKSFRAWLNDLSADENKPAEAIDQPEEESIQRTNTKKKEEGNMDCNQILAQKVIDLTKTVDSQQKYIKELETTAYLHRLLLSVIKDLKKENEILKSEVKIQKDVTNEKNQQIMDLRSQVCHNLDLKKENEDLKSELKIQKDVRNEKNQQIKDLRSQVCHNLQEIASM